MWVSVMYCGLHHPVQMHLGHSFLGWMQIWSLAIFSPFIFTPPHSSFSWNQCFSTLTHIGIVVTGSPVSSLLTLLLVFLLTWAHAVPVRIHLGVFSWCGYWVGDWFSVGIVVLISCHVQSGGGVDHVEGLLMSGRCSLNLLGLHVSCVSMLAVWGQICVQFTEWILLNKNYSDYIL